MQKSKGDIRPFLHKTKSSRKGRLQLFDELKNSGIAIGRETYSEVTGYLFEKFVVSLFNPSYFTLWEWRSDKFCDPVYPGNFLISNFTSRRNLKVCILPLMQIQ